MVTRNSVTAVSVMIVVNDISFEDVELLVLLDSYPEGDK